MKHFQAFAVLLAVATFFTNSFVEGANVNYGKVGPNDVLLYKTKVERPGNPKYITSENVQYPGLGGIEDDPIRTITAVKITDNLNDGDSSKAEIVTGGPGHLSVLIYFEAKHGKGYDYDLEIYGQ